MKKYKPTDATTNPSLILQAANISAYKSLIEKAVHYAKKVGTTEQEKLESAMDMLCVLFGVEILKIVPGRVSTEVDARYSVFLKYKILTAAFCMLENQNYSIKYCMCDNWVSNIITTYLPR